MTKQDDVKTLAYKAEHMLQVVAVVRGEAADIRDLSHGISFGFVHKTLHSNVKMLTMLLKAISTARGMNVKPYCS